MTEEWERAFETFVRAASPGLLRTAVLITGDRGHAEDVLQTTLVRVAKRFDPRDPMPVAYARRVLVNLTRDRHRSRTRRPHEVTFEMHEVAHEHDGYESLLLRDSLLAAVRQLPAQQRAVLVLRYFDDLPVADVAEALGCSPGTVKSHTHRALRTLQSALAPLEEKADAEHTC